MLSARLEFEEPRGSSGAVSGGSRLDLKDPPAAAGGIRDLASQILQTRLELKDPPAAAGGIRALASEVLQTRLVLAVQDGRIDTGFIRGIAFNLQG